MNPDTHPSAGGQVVPAGPSHPFKPCWYNLNLKGERPLGWWGHTVNYIDGKVYVSGGYGKQRNSEIYCIDTACWESKKLPMMGVVPGHRDSHTCTTVGKNLLLVGGSDGNCKCCEVFVFDTEAMEWKVMQPGGRPPAPREGHSATVIGTKLVVFGGVGETHEETHTGGTTTKRRYYGDVNFLDMAEGTWESVLIEGEGPAPRDSHATAAVGNRLVLFGGDNQGNQFMDDVWVLDMATFKWTRMQITSPVSPGPRAGHVAVSVGSNNILVVGGMGPEEERNNETWILRVGPDPIRNLNECQALWEVLDVTGVPLPPGRFSHAADIGDGCLFVIGGCSSSSHPGDDDLHILALSQEASMRVSAGLTNMNESRALQRPVPIPLPATQMQAPFSKSVGRPIKREHEGYPKKITSYNLFCSHHRSMLRDENPELTAREVERLMGQKWSSMVAEEKKPYEDEAYRLNASNMAAFKAQKSVSSDDVEPRVSMGPGDADEKRHKPDSSAGPSGQVCRLFSPNPSLLGAQVEGHVDGAFNSGYLATVRVNGFTYRALLFSPYLALPTPIPANSPGLQPSNHPHHHPNHHESAPPPISPPPPQISATSTGHARSFPHQMDGTISQAAHASIVRPEAHQTGGMVALEHVDTRTQFQVSAPAAVANGGGEESTDAQLRNAAGASIMVEGMYDGDQQGLK
ncbi:hypothetical protein BSKO_00444 [Bryopsis sp. KO-2023]|nr:hypothetical protein BSKO_00444 [Bryopsis sp. KO-2023]